MKNSCKTKFLQFMLAILAISSSQYAIAQEDYIELTFSDTFENAGKSPTKIPALSKVQRVSSNSPSIIITNENELTEEAYKAVDYAMSVWESCLIGDFKVYIQIKIADIEEDIKTTVRYQQKNGLILPVALNVFLEGMADRDSTNPDGVITINSKILWDYSLGDNISPDKKNLPFGIMRAVARILGFGSSIIVEDEGSYKFADKRYHSVFDSMVSDSSNKSLTTISVNRGRPSLELKNYIETPDKTFWLTANNTKYQLAVPPYSKDCPPFVYLNDNNSLMRRDLQVGDYILHVDETTHAILNSLGWDTRPAPLIKIKSDDVDETGLASAYTSHRFYIEKGNLSVSNPRWTLELPLANGGIKSIQIADNNMSCTTPLLEDESLYKINSDGDIEAQLKFTCNVNGSATEVAFKIHFELKPIIDYAVIEKIENSPLHSSYNAYYRVKYRGTDNIKVRMEEEYSSILQTKYIFEPYIAYGVAENINAPYYAWIDFIAENKYGKATYTIELEPYGVIPDNSSSTDSLITGLRTVSIENSAECFYEMYDISGRYIGRFAEKPEIENIQQKGIFIVKKISKNNIETFKLINK